MDISENDKIQMAHMLLSHANSMVIHSGNIINWFTLKKGLNPKSSDELCESVESSLTAWMASIGKELIALQEPLDVLDIQNKEMMCSFEKEQREKIKITTKLFLSNWRPAVVEESVKTVCTSLGVSKLDVLIVSFPITPSGSHEGDDNAVQANVDLQRIKPIWEEMERLVKDGVIDLIGVTDFDVISLKQLHTWSWIKPSINQICMANCCDLPSDILEFSKDHDIELLSHNDPPEMISEKALHNTLNTVTNTSSDEWSPTYCIRYSVVVKCRGIVEAKGYTVGAQRRRDDVGGLG